MIQAAAKPRYLLENGQFRPQLLPNLTLVQCAMVQCANDRADTVPGVALHGERDGVVEQGRAGEEAGAVSEPEVQENGKVRWAEGVAEYIESSGVGEGFGSA